MLAPKRSVGVRSAFQMITVEDNIYKYRIGRASEVRSEQGPARLRVGSFRRHACAPFPEAECSHPWAGSVLVRGAQVWWLECMARGLGADDPGAVRTTRTVSETWPSADYVAIVWGNEVAARTAAYSRCDLHCRAYLMTMDPGRLLFRTGRGQCGVCAM